MNQSADDREHHKNHDGNHDDSEEDAKQFSCTEFRHDRILVAQRSNPPGSATMERGDINNGRVALLHCTRLLD